MIDLRTAKQKARDIEHNKVVNLYLKYKSDPAYNQYSDSRIFEAIANDPAISISTLPGVRQVLVKSGVYTGKR